MWILDKKKKELIIFAETIIVKQMYLISLPQQTIGNRYHEMLDRTLLCNPFISHQQKSSTHL